jgi:hypothetical protein
MTKTVNLRGLPAELVNHARGLAAWRGQTLKQFMIEALEEKVARETDRTHAEVEEKLNGKKNCAKR